MGFNSVFKGLKTTNECKRFPIKFTFCIKRTSILRILFCKYWPDDGRLSSKLVANNSIGIWLCQTDYIFKFILLIRFKRYGMSSTKITSFIVYACCSARQNMNIIVKHFFWILMLFTTGLCRFWAWQYRLESRELQEIFSLTWELSRSSLVSNKHPTRALSLGVKRPL